MEDSSDNDSEVFVFEIKRYVVVTLMVFLFYFRVFSNFLSKLSPFKSAIYFLMILKERGYHMLNARDGT